METCRRIEGLTDFIAGRYQKAAEIGIGHFPDVACALLEKGIKVFATDIHPFHYAAFRVYADDITSPDLALYDGTEVLYSMRPPLELVPYMEKLAKMIPADLIIKPLASEYPDGWICLRWENSTFFLKASAAERQQVF